MLFWVFIIGILLYTVLLGGPANNSNNLAGGALAPTLRRHSARFYQDQANTFYHKYPFDGYTLYGYDDYYPMYRYTWENHLSNQAPEWQREKDRRRLGRPYIQMPSYNFVRQLGKPQ